MKNIAYEEREMRSAISLNGEDDEEEHTWMEEEKIDWELWKRLGVDYA